MLQDLLICNWSFKYSYICGNANRSEIWRSGNVAISQ